MNQMKEFEGGSQAFRVPILSNFVNPNRKKGKSFKSGAMMGLKGQWLNAFFGGEEGHCGTYSKSGWLWKRLRGLPGASQ